MATVTPGFYDQDFYAQELLASFKAVLGLPQRLHNGYDRERKARKRGQFIDIKRPAVFVAEDAPGTLQDVVPDNLQIQLNSHKIVRFPMPDKTQAYTGPEFVRDHIQPAAYALAKKVNADIAALALTVPHAFIEPSAATSATINGVTSTYQKLFDLEANVEDTANMHFMIGGKEQNDLAQLAGLGQWQGAGEVGVNTQLSGQLGQRLGFNFFAAQSRPTVAYAAFTDFAGAIDNASGYAKGATTIHIDTLAAAEVIKKGTIIKITNGADAGSEYAVTADATLSSNECDVTINPGLRHAVLDDATITVAVTQGEATGNQAGVKTNNVNLAFRREWAAIGFAQLPDFSEYGGLGTRASVIQDEQTGISIRSLFYYDGDNLQMIAVSDVLYGIKELNPDFACRYEIKAS